MYEYVKNSLNQFYNKLIPALGKLGLMHVSGMTLSALMECLFEESLFLGKSIFSVKCHLLTLSQLEC